MEIPCCLVVLKTVTEAAAKPEVAAKEAPAAAKKAPAAKKAAPAPAAGKNGGAFSLGAESLEEFFGLTKKPRLVSQTDKTKQTNKERKTRMAWNTTGDPRSLVLCDVRCLSSCVARVPNGRSKVCLALLDSAAPIQCFPLSEVYPLRGCLAWYVFIQLSRTTCCLMWMPLQCNAPSGFHHDAPVRRTRADTDGRA